MNYCFWVIQYYRWVKGKKWDPESMKAAAIEAVRNKEMGSCTAASFHRSQTTLELYFEDRQKSSNKSVKTKLGRKQVLPCEAENDLSEHRLDGKKVFSA